MQQELLLEESEKKIVIKLVDNRQKLTQEELELLWEAIECGQNNTKIFTPKKNIRLAKKVI